MQVSLVIGLLHPLPHTQLQRKKEMAVVQGQQQDGVSSCRRLYRICVVIN